MPCLIAVVSPLGYSYSVNGADRICEYNVYFTGSGNCTTTQDQGCDVDLPGFSICGSVRDIGWHLEFRSKHSQGRGLDYVMRPVIRPLQPPLGVVMMQDFIGSDKGCGEGNIGLGNRAPIRDHGCKKVQP
ncbi:hypothetical protein V6N12_048600 [Hibiscus sabdariffa]|uniref:Uncharacterized protein n=1 Tax=Hibiscus sabdariffa TaxID=183260 RepID=A0ABR2EHQ5_9ROSI